MADLRNHDPLVETVAKARAAVSQRPDIKFPVGNYNIIDNHLYAYSGVITSTDSATPITMLKYTTGVNTQICLFQFFDVVITDKERIFKITLNNKTIIQNNYDGSDPSFPYNGQFHVTVPPYTEIEVSANINGASDSMYVTMTGRIV